MKREYFIALLFIPLFIMSSVKLLFGQEWTAPVNVSNLGGYSMEPDMIIDHKGIIHVVWRYLITGHHHLILYSNSEDDGATWSEPLDLLQNTDLWMLQPHIACDSKNNLYVTYTHDGYNWTPEGRLIKMLTYNGYEWSEPIVLSGGMPLPHYNKIQIDHNDRVIVSWSLELTGDRYFRFFENNLWSDAFCPYPGGAEIYALGEAALDKNNSLHWIGASMGYAYPTQERLQYYYYDNFQNYWYPPVMPVKDTIDVGQDIALNNNEIPQSTYRKESTIAVGETSDSTMFIKKEENWSNPKLVSGTNKRQEGQQIAIDQNNDVHVVETEFYASSVLETEIVHYSKLGNKWQKQVIDSSKHMCHFPNLFFFNNQLYVIYYKSDVPLIGDLRFSKYDIVTAQKEQQIFSGELKTYPNPSDGNVTIEFANSIQQSVNISIFDINGNQIKTLIDKKMPQGQQQVLWDGTMQNGKKVKSGSYLVRLQAGNKSQTQTVEIVR